jgi:hypothetical protein
MATRVMVYTREELYTYRETAGIVEVSIDAVFQAARTGVVTRVRLPHSREMYIVKDEVEALRGFGRITSKEARVKIEQVRRERGMEKEYNEDGTPNWMGKSDLERVIAENNAVMEEVKQQLRNLGDKLHVLSEAKNMKQMLKALEEMMIDA